MFALDNILFCWESNHKTVVTLATPLTVHDCLITARSLDKYFEQRVKQVELKEDVQIDPRLVSIVERMLDR